MDTASSVFFNESPQDSPKIKNEEAGKGREGGMGENKARDPMRGKKASKCILPLFQHLPLTHEVGASNIKAKVCPWLKSWGINI